MNSPGASFSSSSRASFSSARTSFSSSTPPWIHDVFLSFRGETRKGFTSHLYDALIREGINTYRDKEKLRIGKIIRPELLEAIQESRFAIVVLSKNYASSKWCLDELAQMVECMEMRDLVVVPVFYHVDPSDVRHQRNTFELAFAKHERNESAEKVKTWRAACQQIGYITGPHINGDRYESEVISEIVRSIFQELQHTSSRAVTKDLVGIESRLEELNRLLCIKLNDVRFIGICGMSGIGKTVLADAVYKDLRDQFEGDSFIGNIKDISRKSDNDLCKLQQKVLVDILKDESIRVRSVNEGVSMMQRRLRGIKILLVLDDVNDPDQLNFVAKEHEWFGCGSRILITTTNEDLLTAHNVDGKYKCEQLNFDDACRLFYLSAFGTGKPKQGYEKLSKDIMELACGLPLALNIFGSLLFDKEENYWRDTLRMLQHCPNKKILERLEICYDRLDRNAQEIFIYLACFLKGRDEGLVRDILKSIGGLYPIPGIDILINRSLITIYPDNSVWMHDLLQQMGWEILHKRFPKEPGKRTGLKSRQDIVDIATSKEKGTVAIEIINQDSCGFEVEDCTGDHQSFSEMKRLKFLRIGNVLFPNGLEYLSNDLRILIWKGCYLKSLPSTFKPKQLFEVDMRSSRLKKLWKNNMDLPNLRSINLSHSVNLTKIPDLTLTPKLVRLNLEGCTNLVEVHQSILVHKSLKYVNLKGCIRLESFGSNIIEMEAVEDLLLSGCSKLERIPEFGEKMKCLEHLYLDGTNIKKLPENLGKVRSLLKLDVSGTAIQELPSSILYLNRLRLLSFHGCHRLLPNKSLLSMNLEMAFFPLRELNLSDCNLSNVPDSFAWFSGLTVLDLSGNDFITLPTSICQLSSLRLLLLDRCKRLQSLPKLPRMKNDTLYGPTVRFSYYISGEELDISKFHISGNRIHPAVSCLNCPKLVENASGGGLADTILEKYLQVGVAFEVIPEATFEIVGAGSEIPEWFNHQGVGNSITFELPPGWYNGCFGIALCAVYVVHHAPTTSTDGSAKVKYEIVANIHFEGRDAIILLPVSFLKAESKNQFVLYWTVSNELRRAAARSQQSRLSICFPVRPEDGNMEVKKYGARFLYMEDLAELKDSKFTDGARSRGNWSSNEGVGSSRSSGMSQFLIPLVAQLLTKMADPILREIGRIWRIDRDLRRLEDALSAKTTVLMEANEQSDISESARDWLQKALVVLYDLDDVLDDLMTEDLRWKLKRKEVTSFFSSSNTISFRVKISLKIKKLRERLEDINTDWRNYHFVERVLDNQTAYRPREETHSYIHGSDAIGRDYDKKEIIKLLIDSKSRDTNLCVLPIVGLGGIGKTTLAKLVYNDPEIDKHFVKRIWVCVSEDFEIESLLKKIVKAAHANIDLIADLDLDQLGTCLRNYLKSKKFLLVLDDVWNEDLRKWTDFTDFLSCGAQGSTIVVTTRNNRIAEFMGTFPPCSLRVLSRDDCLSIFLKCAFRDGQGKEYPKLVEIGKVIVEKCCENPLALRTLGSLLSTSTEESKWNFVKWKLAQNESTILTIFRLSYEQMPVHLRSCFAYCSTFPFYHEFECLDLIYRWISQGLVKLTDGEKQIEDIGNYYINDLISRSFFQDVKMSFDGKVLTFKMHDLIYDFAQSVASREISIANLDAKKVIGKNVCHLLFTEEKVDGEEFPRSLIKLENVRSFQFAFMVGRTSKIFLDTLVKSFKRLRVLDLSRSEIEEFPDSIGTLTHLRYLNLCVNGTLPNSFCNLVNLISLSYNCPKLQKFPKDFDKLGSLRYLRLTSELITCLPEKGLQGLRSLRYLYILKCYRLESLSEGVEYLIALRRLVIRECPRLTSIPQCIRYLTSLEELFIEDCEKLDLLEEEGIEGLTSLRTLSIWRLPMLNEFPRGLQNCAATLKYLIIGDCSSLETLTWLKTCTSLLKLAVLNCMHLESLSPGMHQLIALWYLEIKGCPLLTQKCERETGEYWPWMQHVREVHMSS